MTADEVRELLEKELGGPFTDTTWKRVYKNDVEYYLQNQNPREWQTLKGQAEDLFEYEKELKQELASDGNPTPRKRRQRQRKSRQNQEVEEEHWFPELSREEMLRAEVYGEYLAKVAAAHFYVARYRKRVLGERTATFTPDQAHSLIRSPAAQALPTSFFRGVRIPVGDHDAAFLDPESHLDEEESVGDYATIRVRWSENPEGIEWSVQSVVTEGKDGTRLWFRNEKGKDEFIAVRRDSVLGELQRRSSRLTEQFPWREAQATWFILTGEPPLVPPVEVRYTSRPARVHLKPSGDTERFGYGEVNISAAHWVSEQIVAEVFFNLQQRILPGEQNRTLGWRRLELLRFVLERENPVELTRASRRRIGKELVEAWDKEKPHWAYVQYDQPTSAFWDAFNDAESQVMYPSWTHPRKLRQTSADSSMSGSNSGSNGSSKQRH
jgi:hypothetical protein